MPITDEVTAGVLRENNVINLPLLGGIPGTIEVREAAAMIQDLIKEEENIHHVMLWIDIQEVIAGIEAVVYHPGEGKGVEMIHQEEGIGVDIGIVLAVVGKDPVEEIDDIEGGEMKITAKTEEITTLMRDRITTIEKKGMMVLEL